MTKYKPRNKAFIGALIGAAVAIGSAIGSGVSAAKKRRSAEYQAELNQRRDDAIQNSIDSANAMNESLVNQDKYRQAFRSQYMRCGGKRKANFGTEFTAALPGITSGVSNLVNTLTNNPQFGQAVNAAGNFTQNMVAARNNEKLQERQDAARYIDSSNVIGAVVQNRFGGRRCAKRCGGRR